MLDKKQLIVPLAIATIVMAGIVGWEINKRMSVNTAITSQPSPGVTKEQNLTSEIAKSQNSIVEKIAKEVTVRVFTESVPGSGAIVFQQSKGRQGNIYSVLTCQHVIADSKKGVYRVLLPDGKIYPARVKSTPKLKGLDLAIIEFDSDTIYRVAKLGKSDRLGTNTSVYAAGFPNHHVVNSAQIEDTSDWGLHAFRVTTGKVGSISPQQLPDGYSLGYTNEVASGMSGGPVFNDRGELIGINGRLKYPVEGIDAFVYADGTKPSIEVFQQMEALSWAIPIATYQQSFNK
ncbi:S1 family peptidase [Chamaesiphon polymorphus]|uniref:Serine protease n=1 Tax=Chamaesiphon polymorphus CCALA 037 TaxID=2107692 RepID=A0A2T1GFG6_9CYAN|nr:serine protease [Chamaesiphon polymorphus]PSB56351.1 serine protease [Chamaesiphon polymorphus CCALA 037]